MIGWVLYSELFFKLLVVRGIMDKRLTLNVILLEWLNRILNPNFEVKFISTLLFSGVALVGYQRIIQIGSSLEFLSGERYIKLSLTSGADTIFIVVGSVMILVACCLYCIRLCNSKSELSDAFDSLAEAANEIRPIMDENRRMFMAFGPNSESGRVGDICHDFEVWKKLKSEQILPNNNKILSFLDRVISFKSDESAIVSAMRSHIQAFKVHCDNPSFDYSKHQFPLEFSDLIFKYCSDGPNSICKYKEWLAVELDDIKMQIEAAYIYGSALYGQEKIDLDLIVKTKYITIEDIKNNAFLFERLKINFKENFNLDLHLKVFSELENNSFIKFMGKIISPARII